MRSICRCIAWIAIASLGLTLSACKGGASSEADNGDFSVSVSTLNMIGVTSDTGSITGGFEVTALNGSIFIDVSTTGPFSASSNLSGGASAYVTVTASSPARVGVGTHRGTITINAYRDVFGNIPAQGSPKVVNVVYNVTAGIDASPGFLGFSYAIGAANPATATVNVAAPNGENWSAAVNQPWITLDEYTGTGPGPVSVIVSPEGLLAGTHTGNVTFTLSSNGVAKTVDISFEVASPKILADDYTLFFPFVYGGTPPDSQSITLTMNNETAVNWSAAADSSWIVLDPISGTTPGTLTVGVYPTGLDVGNYMSAVQITGEGITEETSVNVGISISTPRLNINADSLVSVV